MLSSLAFYAAIYVDRLYLGRVVPLATLGIYGLAKAIADLPNMVAGRLAFQIVFPFVSAQKTGLEDGSAARRDHAARARAGIPVTMCADTGSPRASSASHSRSYSGR